MLKVVFYSENLFEHFFDIGKLENEYPDLAYRFNKLLRLRYGYRFDNDNLFIIVNIINKLLL